MGIDWLIEFLWGTGKLFIHPLFYYSIFLCLLLGYMRVKRERKDFKIRAESGYFELQNLFPLGILVGLALSIVTVAAGFILPMAAIVIMAGVTVLLSLTMKFRWLSPAYVIGISIFLFFFLHNENYEIPFLQDMLQEMDGPVVPAMGVLMALLMLGEGFLIKRNAAKGTSPRLITSNRGMTVGVHVSKRIWFVPLFLFIPGGELTAPFEWWPVFPVGDNMSVSPILVPFLIGFSQQVQGRLPKHSISITGDRVIALAVVVLAVAVASIWMPVFSIAVAAVALLGRESIHYSAKMAEKRLPFYFAKRDHGVLILGIIPYSPAEKMGLEVGEIITKVNGTTVNTERELYEALQRNRAHCRLEVLDTHDQIRFVQRALFEGEHYELGILFAEEKRAEDVAI